VCSARSGQNVHVSWSQPLHVDAPFWRSATITTTIEGVFQMRVRFALGHRHRDEGGAVVLMLAILLVVMFGILVLTVDLGGTVGRKRGMVRAADAAALAAAQACTVTVKRGRWPMSSGSRTAWRPRTAHR